PGSSARSGAEAPGKSTQGRITTHRLRGRNRASSAAIRHRSANRSLSASSREQEQYGPRICHRVQVLASSPALSARFRPSGARVSAARRGHAFRADRRGAQGARRDGARARAADQAAAGGVRRRRPDRPADRSLSARPERGAGAAHGAAGSVSAGVLRGAAPRSAPAGRADPRRGGDRALRHSPGERAAEHLGRLSRVRQRRHGRQRQARDVAQPLRAGGRAAARRLRGLTPPLGSTLAPRLAARCGARRSRPTIATVPKPRGSAARPGSRAGEASMTRTTTFIPHWAAVAVAIGALPAGAAAQPRATVDEAALAGAALSGDEWLTYGRDYAETRFSPLADIDAGNVRRLGLAWYYDTGALRGLEATPLVADGVLYATTSWSNVFALDARTGDLLWRWESGADRARGSRACCDVVNRGVALYEGKVFVGVIDGRLVALDAATGEPVWQVQTTPVDEPYTITGAPRVYDGKVLIGNGGAELGVRGFRSGRAHV